MSTRMVESFHQNSDVSQSTREDYSFRKLTNSTEYEKFKDKGNNLIKCQKKVVKKLEDLATELDAQQRIIDTAQVSFASTGIVGGGLAIAGLGLSFFTFGASLSLTAAGSAIGFTSGLGGVATTIANEVINNSKVKEAAKAIREYNTAFEEFQIALDTFLNLVAPEDKTTASILLERVRNIPDIVGALIGGWSAYRAWEALQAQKAKKTVASVVSKARKASVTVSKGGKTASKTTSLVKASTEVCKTATDVGKTAFNVLSKGEKAVKIGGALVSAIGIGFDIYTIVSTCKKNKLSEIADNIRNLAKNIGSVEEIRL